MLRLLGFLFLLLLVIAGFGLFRGWFSVTTVEAGGITLTFNANKVKSDTAKATETIGELSTKAAERIRQLARRVSDVESVVEGSIVDLHPTTRSADVAVAGESEPVAVTVDTAALVSLNGQPSTFGQLAIGDHLTLTLHKDGASLRVVKVEAKR